MQERLFVESGLVKELVDAAEVCCGNLSHLVRIDSLSLRLLVDILISVTRGQGAHTFTTLILTIASSEGLRGTGGFALM